MAFHIGLTTSVILPSKDHDSIDTQELPHTSDESHKTWHPIPKVPLHLHMNS
jgi:hypothetical protein